MTIIIDICKAVAVILCFGVCIVGIAGMAGVLMDEMTGGGDGW